MADQRHKHNKRLILNFTIIVWFLSIVSARISEGSVSKVTNKPSFSSEESSLNVHLELISVENNELALENAPLNARGKRVRRVASASHESEDSDYDDEDFEGNKNDEVENLVVEKLKLEGNTNPSGPKNSVLEGKEESELFGSQTMEDLRELEIFAKNAKANIMRTHQSRILELQKHSNGSDSNRVENTNSN